LKATKSFKIAKQVVWEAYQQVKRNGGSSGIDGQSISNFEINLKDNLYKIWNRLSSGTYFPPSVKGVEIPKKSGGVRVLGIPTVSDRIAQMAVKILLEPKLEPLFDPDSYGYRPNKSAHDAIKITRERCWKYDWVIEFDIKGLFDNLSHKLLMKALKHHCDCKHTLLYIERWLEVPLIKNDGEILARTQGTPQGGVISPLLANLFMHYAFDAWVRRTFSEIPFCRYADDGLLHCQSKKQAEHVLEQLGKRFQECGLELHPKKTKIIYCKDRNRKAEYENIQFDFLGYTFRPRRCVDKKGVVHPNFLPAISRVALKSISREIRRWNIAYLSDKSVFDLSRMYNSKIVGWQNYYGRYYPSALNTIWERINWYLVRWLRRKYKKLAKHKIRAIKFLRKIAVSHKNLFKHWSLGII